MAELTKRKNILIQVFILATSVLLLGKAFQIQVMDRQFREKANAIAIDTRISYPSRGLIFDRNDKLLVFNNPIYSVSVVYNRLDPAMDTSRFCLLLDITREEFIKNMDVDWSRNSYSKNLPFVFKKQITAEQFSQFQESLHEFPGFEVGRRNVRGYPHSHAAHVLGYLNEVNLSNIEKNPEIYARGDYVGVTGIEAKYERLLRGTKGFQLKLKDNLGREVGPYNNRKLDSLATSGSDLKLTIDIDLQALGEQLMQNKSGGIVAIDPASGEILSLISSPNYSPDLLSIGDKRAEAFSKLQKDSLQPFFNRATMAKYPPGSIIKPILGLIALQEGVIEKNTRVFCGGGYNYTSRYNTYYWGCHGPQGSKNVVQAIIESCNTFFYHTYKELVDIFGFSNPEKGLDLLAEYLAQFGLGKPLGVDLSPESSGKIPDTKYYDEMYKDEDGDWRSTYIISNGIGQGEMELTTIQMANLAAILANKGYYYTPHLLKGVTGAFSMDTNPYPTQYRVAIDQEHFETIIEAMKKAVSIGTASIANIPGMEVCGKTGTSQNPHGEDHSVFFGFAPKENPKIAIAVYVENVGWGASYAAPIASLLMEKYLNNTVAPNRQYLLDRMTNSSIVGL